MRTLVVAFAIVMLFANIATAELTFKDLTSWDEIYTTSDENTIKIVLKNPNEGKYNYALVELGDGYIKYYILVGNDIEMYVFTGGGFENFEMSEEAKKNVWTFLRDQLGIRTI